MAVLTVVPTFAAGLPGTTVGDNCTSYKQIPFSTTSSQEIDYLRCTDGTTVKFVYYAEPGGVMYQYAEFRDALGNLVESRFGRAPAMGSPLVPLADSVSP